MRAVANSGPEDPAAMKVAPATSGSKLRTIIRVDYFLLIVGKSGPITCRHFVQGWNKVVVAHYCQANEHVDSDEDVEDDTTVSAGCQSQEWSRELFNGRLEADSLLDVPFFIVRVFVSGYLVEFRSEGWGQFIIARVEQSSSHSSKVILMVIALPIVKDGDAQEEPDEEEAEQSQASLEGAQVSGATSRPESHIAAVCDWLLSKKVGARNK